MPRRPTSTQLTAAQYDALERAIGFDQESRYHDLSLDEHTFRAVQAAAEAGAPLQVRLAVLLHDLGKPEASWRGPDGRFHFYANPQLGKRSHEEIGAEIAEGDGEFQNEVDDASLYQLLENQIIPLYYAKPDGKLPLAWLQLMRESIRSVTPVFNTQRMVEEYTERLYLPAARAHQEFARDGWHAATVLSQWKAQMRKDWPQVRITDVQIRNKDRQNIHVGDSLQVAARVHLGALDPKHVRVEAYHGEAENDAVRNPVVTLLGEGRLVGGDGEYIYEGAIPASESGTYGFNLRVIPTYPHLLQAHELRLIAWG